MNILTPALAALAATTALTAPGPAPAAELKLDTRMRSYGGEPAYAAFYLTDAEGRYVRTLWLAAGKARWWDSLSAWYRATGGARAEIAGLTGASIGSGRSLSVTVEVADALIDAGYQIRVDTAVEHGAKSPAEVVVPLSSAKAGKAVAGRGYIASFSFDM